MILIMYKCTSAGDVGEMSVGLLGGDNFQEGIVEIANNGRWKMLYK